MEGFLLDTTIGEKLKKARLKKEISIQEISVKTKVPILRLKDLENNNFGTFSSHSHAKGFIKIYANCLGLNGEPLIAQYRRDHENINIKKRSQIEVKDIDKEEPLIKKFVENLKSIEITKKRASFGITFIIVIMGLLVVLSLVRKTFTPPLLLITEPVKIEANYEGEIEYEGGLITLKGETDDNSRVKINNLAVRKSGGNIFISDPIPLIEEENRIIIEASNSLGSKATIRLTIKKPAFGAEQNKYLVIIKIKDDNTFLLARADGEIKYNEEFRQNDSFSIEFQDILEIESTHPENIAVIYSNKETTLTNLKETFTVNENGEISHLAGI